jgi:hypothetical protein
MNLDRNTKLLVSPTNHPDDVALLNIAARTRRALAPVAPTPEFRARLRDGLQMAAYHREMHELLVRQPAETPWGLLVGAAALGSAAGLLAMLLRARQSAHTEEQVVAREPTA